jgi:hypothetical protein
MPDYQSMPSHSRVWVYQANREFSSQETDRIKERATLFLQSWTSHEHHMKACIKVLYNRFIIVLADENIAHASGCGIDKSLKFIQGIEKEFSLSLLDRTMVAYRSHATHPIQTCPLSDLKLLADSTTLYVFNNLVSTKEEFETNWEIPIEKSWHKKFL